MTLIALELTTSVSLQLLNISSYGKSSMLILVVEFQPLEYKTKDINKKVTFESQQTSKVRKWGLISKDIKTNFTLLIWVGNTKTDVTKLGSQRWHCKQYHLKLFTFLLVRRFWWPHREWQFFWPPKSTFHAIWELKYSAPAEFGKT